MRRRSEPHSRPAPLGRPAFALAAALAAACPALAQTKGPQPLPPMPAAPLPVPQIAAPQYATPQSSTSQYPTPQSPAPQSSTSQYPTPQSPAPSTSQYPTPQSPSPQSSTSQYPTPQYPTPQSPTSQYPTLRPSAPGYPTPQIAAPQPGTPQGGLPAPSSGASFESWKQGFIERAVARGLDRSFVEAELVGVTPDPRVLAFDGRQPEFSRPPGDYVRAALSDARVAEARERLATTPHLSEIEARYGVPGAILIGIWAEETGFGVLQGDFDVVRDFATLAYDGRRRAWAETQLIDALMILHDRGVPRSRLRGSWAGAMGQTQFIPEAYLKLGQDGDGDGRIDMWGSAADALASAANLLAHEGWRPGESWAVEAAIPAGFDYSLAESEKHPPAWWADHGVKRADGRSWSAADQASEAALILPAGASGPAFLAFPNHYVIRKYNNSTSYALAVGLVADAARGEPPVMKPWPSDTPLSRDQRLAAQTALTRLGYPVGEIDGVIGTGTRAALKAWQKSQGLTPDGYLNTEMVRRLQTAVGT